MAHRHVAGQGRKDRFIENIGHQAHVFKDNDAVIIAHRNARGFLPAVLESKKAKVGKFRDFLPGSPDAKDATLFAGFLLVMIVKVSDTRSMYFYHGVYISALDRRKLTE